MPTMGYLHEGHLTLVRRARAECDYVVVSIFVNPLQFGPSEDFDAYPRDPTRDRKLLRSESVDLIYEPAAETLYPSDFSTHVEVGSLAATLCGPHRPGHFRGVATVCAKLFNAAPADRAYFGEKDYQQLAIIRRMVRDLNFPLEIIGVPTVREPDGLAMSSRNVRLSPAERQAAAVLYRALEAAQSSDQTAARVRVDIARRIIAAEPLARIEYIEIVDSDTLAPVATVDRECRMALAAWFGQTRLIDNIAVSPR